MPIDDETKIDGMGIDPETCVVMLIISDHLDWSSTKAHFDLLERKINAYLDFIGGGQLEETLPDAAGRRSQIRRSLKHEPHLDARATLNAVTERLAALGIGFRYGPLPEGY